MKMKLFDIFPKEKDKKNIEFLLSYRVCTKRIERYACLFLDEKDMKNLNTVYIRINRKYLKYIINRNDYYIDFLRHIVISRVDKKYLPLMINNENRKVRMEVALRIDPSYLSVMLYDKEYYIRKTVERRLRNENETF